MNPSLRSQILAQFPDVAEVLERLEVEPGSKEAKAKGCVCPSLAISAISESKKTTLHFINQTCPLHRTE